MGIFTFTSYPSKPSKSSWAGSTGSTRSRQSFVSLLSAAVPTKNESFQIITAERKDLDSDLGPWRQRTQLTKVVRQLYKKSLMEGSKDASSNVTNQPEDNTEASSI